MTLFSVSFFDGDRRIVRYDDARDVRSRKGGADTSWRHEPNEVEELRVSANNWIVAGLIDGSQALNV